MVRTFPLILVLSLVVGLALSGCAAAVMNGMATGDEPAAADGQPSPAQDANIARALRTAIYRDPLLMDERLQVSVTRGIVTLRGTVGDQRQVRRALQLAEDIDGVRGVNLELKLRNIQ